MNELAKNKQQLLELSALALKIVELIMLGKAGPGVPFRPHGDLGLWLDGLCLGIRAIPGQYDRRNDKISFEEYLAGTGWDEYFEGTVRLGDALARFILQAKAYMRGELSEVSEHQMWWMIFEIASVGTQTTSRDFFLAAKERGIDENIRLFDLEPTPAN